MNEFTKGEWVVDESIMAAVNCDEKHIAMVNINNNGLLNAVTKYECLANSHLIATAGTTATKLAEQGYDAVKMLEVLPALMSELGDLLDGLSSTPELSLRSWGIDEEDISKLLEQCRGE